MNDIEPVFDIQRRISYELQTIKSIWAAMKCEVAKAGFINVLPDEPPPFDSAVINIDPFDQCSSLCVEWHDANKVVVGSMVIYSQGTLFSEYDLVKPHPQNSALFVESVTAFGRKSSISTELKTIPYVV